MNITFTPYIYILFFGLFFTQLHGQNWELKITPTDSISKQLLSSITYRSQLTNENDLPAEIDSLLIRLEEYGAFTPQLQFINKEDRTFIYHLTAGPVFKEITLCYNDNQLDDFLHKTTYKIDKKNITIPIENTKAFLKSIVAYFEEKGYSFVDVVVLNQSIVNNKLIGALQIQYKTKRTIDKISIEGYERFPKSFIKHQTPLKMGTTFNQQKIAATSNFLQRLNFVQQLKEPAVLFTNDSTFIYLYLKKKKAHQLDGLIGFNNSANNAKLKLHGYVDIELNNLFDQGEQLGIHWQNTTQKQTSFQLKTSIPLLFNTPITMVGNFDLHKQDSTYLTTSVELGLMYQFQKHRLKTSIQSQSSNILLSIPNTLWNDYTKISYGLSHSFMQNKPNRFFSTEFASDLNVYTSNRTMKTDKSTQQKVDVTISYTWEINPRNYLFIQHQAAKMIGNHFLTNELMLIGGSNTIRGFNENELLSSSNQIYTVEYRLVTAVDSFFYTITDYGKNSNKIEASKTDLVGLGFGYAFKFNSGLLNISYSLGKFSNTSFDFNQSKIHLKWIQFF